MHTYAQAKEYLTEDRNTAELDAFNQALGREAFKADLSIPQKLASLRRSIARHNAEDFVPLRASAIMSDAGIPQAMQTPASQPATAPVVPAPTSAAPASTGEAERRTIEEVQTNQGTERRITTQRGETAAQRIMRWFREHR